MMDLQMESEIRADKYTTLKETLRQVEFEVVDLQLSAKKAKKEADISVDLINNLERDNARKANQIKEAQDYGLNLQLKQRAITYDIEKSKDDQFEVTNIL